MPGLARADRSDEGWAGDPEMVPDGPDHGIVRVAQCGGMAEVPGFFGQGGRLRLRLGLRLGLGHGGVVVPRQLAFAAISGVRMQDLPDARLVELGGGDAEVALGLLELAFGRGRQATLRVGLDELLGNTVAEPAFLALCSRLIADGVLGIVRSGRSGNTKPGPAPSRSPRDTRQNVIYIRPGPGGSSSPGAGPCL